MEKSRQDIFCIYRFFCLVRGFSRPFSPICASVVSSCLDSWRGATTWTSSCSSSWMTTRSWRAALVRCGARPCHAPDARDAHGYWFVSFAWVPHGFALVCAVEQDLSFLFHTVTRPAAVAAMVLVSFAGARRRAMWCNTKFKVGFRASLAVGGPMSVTCPS